MTSATLYYNGNTFPLEIDLTDTVEVLQLQIFSITGIEDSSQILYVPSYPGPLSPTKPLSSCFTSLSSSSSSMNNNDNNNSGSISYDIVLIHSLNNALARLRQTTDVSSSVPVTNNPSDIDLHQQEQFKNQLTNQWKSNCTRIYSSQTSLVQPAYRIQPMNNPPTTSLRGNINDLTGATIVCHACSQNCWLPNQAVPTYLANSSSSSSSYGNHNSFPSPFLCQCSNRTDGGSCLFAPRYGNEQYLSKGSTGELLQESLSNAVDSLQLQHQLQVLLSSSSSSSSSSSVLSGPPSPAMQQMVNRIRGSASHMKAYTVPSTIEKARKTLPIADLHIQATKAFQKDQTEFSSTVSTTVTLPLTFERALLNELVVWFKTKFFQWTNNIPCEHCQSSETVGAGGAPPTPNEQMVGEAGMVELYSCRRCSKVSRFPRYNNPAILLDTHRGRCGEWANCFTLCALTFGFEARHVVDWTDHVWTEVWLPYPYIPQEGAMMGYHPPRAGRWHHVDSCEATIDAPLLYEAGWGKKLNFVIAFGLDEIIDVTRRYTKQYKEVLGRRKDINEVWLQQVIRTFDQLQRKAAVQGSGITTVRQRYLHDRTFYELRELEANIHYDNHVRKEEESQGRISGSYAWRYSRGELGSTVSSSSSSSSSSASNVSSGSSTAGSADMYAVPSTYPNGVLSGWTHVLNHDKPDNDDKVIHLTSWNNQFLGILENNQGKRKIMWQSIPSSVPSSSSTAGIHQWKPLSIVEWSTKLSDPVPFPKDNEQILSCVAEPNTLRFYILTSTDTSTSSGIRCRLYIVQPGEVKVWKAIKLTESTLNISRALSINDKLSLILANDTFYLHFSQERLYYLEKSLSFFLDILPTLPSTNESDNPSFEWKVLQDCTVLNSMFSLHSNMLLGQSNDTLYLGMVKQVPIMKSASTSIPLCTSSLQYTKDTDSANIRLTYPSIIAVGDSLAIQIETSVQSNPIHVNDDWITFTYIGQSSESSVAGRKEGTPVSAIQWNTTGIIPSIIEGKAQWKNVVSNTGNRYEALFSPTSLPTVPGLYELRYYRGPTFHNLVGIATIPIMMTNKDTVSAGTITNNHSTVTFIPLCPSTNVQCICGNQDKLIYAYTSSQELWYYSLTITVTNNASRWMKTNDSSDSLLYAPIVPSIDRLKQIIAYGLFEIPTTVPLRLNLLFRQKTKGCTNIPCNHPHCASNPKVGPSPPNIAAAQSVPLAASGATEYFCPFMQA